MENATDSAVALLIDRSSSVPLVLAIAREGNLFDVGFPGGKREPGETTVECARRELFEETGIEALGEAEFVYHGFARTRFCVTYMFNKWKGTLRGNDREGEPLWVTPRALVMESCTYKNYNRAALIKAKLLNN